MSSVEGDTPTQQWLPSDLVDSVRRSGARRNDRWAEERFLFIDLDGASDRLLTGLMVLSSGHVLSVDSSSMSSLISSTTSGVDEWRQRIEQEAQRILQWAGSRAGYLVPIDTLDALIYTGRAAVGRSPEADLVLRDNSVSRLHGWLERAADGQLWLLETGSKNGTFVNDRRVESRVALQPGDEVMLGRVRMLLCGGAALATALLKAS